MGAKNILDKLNEFSSCTMEDPKKIGDCFNSTFEKQNDEIPINLEGFKKIDSIDLFEKNIEMFNFMTNKLLNSNNKKLEPKFEETVEKHIRNYLSYKGIELDEELKIIKITKKTIVLDKTNLKSYNGKLLDKSNDDIVISFGNNDNIESNNNTESFFSNNYSGKKLYDNPKNIKFTINSENFEIKKDESGICFYKNGVKLETIKFRTSYDVKYDMILNEKVGYIYFFKSIGGRAILKTTDNQLFDLKTMKKIDLNKIISETDNKELFGERKYFNFILSVSMSKLFKKEIINNFKVKLKKYLEGKNILIKENYKIRFSHREGGYISISYESIESPKVRNNIKVTPEKIEIPKILKTIEEVKEEYFSGKFSKEFTKQENDAIQIFLDNNIIIDMGIRYMKTNGILKNTKKDIEEEIKKNNIERTFDFIKY